MLNRLAAISLIFFTLSANFTRLYIYAGFEMNQKYIAAALCENKDKPWLHCNGKCFLMKRLKQAEDKEKSEERQAGKSRFQEAVVNQTFNVKFSAQLLSVIAADDRPFQLPQRSAVIFQPPKINV